jgi:predicted HTH domain antitoxin
MEHQISIDYPESLADALKMKKKEFRNEIKVLSLIKLYELGRISSGNASKLLNISRADFLDLLGKYKASYFFPGQENELEADVSNA